MSSPNEDRRFDRSSDAEKIKLSLNSTTPQLSRRDPSIPNPPTTSKLTPAAYDPEHTENPKVPWCKRAKKYVYNKEDKTFCSRTCDSWAKIIGYAIMYMLFLATYTMFFLYFSLLLIKNKNGDKFSTEESMMSLLTYSVDKVGLSGVPLSEHNYPLIYYRNGEADDYNKYVLALDDLLEQKRQKRTWETSLGPCGKRPYGYGDQPCILIKINRQRNWAAKVLTPASRKFNSVPEEVQKWIIRDAKHYWLHCTGYHNYDKEHIGKITYYPDPPGFDSTIFPLDENTRSPLVAVQISNFTFGISLAIECKLWYEAGSSSIAFMLYVSPKRKNYPSRRW